MIERKNYTVNKRKENNRKNKINDNNNPKKKPKTEYVLGHCLIKKLNGYKEGGK